VVAPWTVPTQPEKPSEAAPAPEEAVMIDTSGSTGTILPGPATLSMEPVAIDGLATARAAIGHLTFDEMLRPFSARFRQQSETEQQAIAAAFFEHATATGC
jgi:hypothetical protein